jgi:hypothetical protein
MNQDQMILKRRYWARRGLVLGEFVLFSAVATVVLAAAPGSGQAGAAFPPPLESYNDAHLTNLWDILRNRVEKQPFNLWATLLA